MSGAISVSTIAALFLDILYVTPFLLPILIGFCAERIFKTKLFGRLPDIAIGLVGGIDLYIVAASISSVYANSVAEKSYADLVKRGIDTTGKFPPGMLGDLPLNIIFTAAAVVRAHPTLHRPAICRTSRPKHVCRRAGTDLRNGTVGHDGTFFRDGTNRQSDLGPV